MTIDKIERFVHQYLNQPHYIDVHMKCRNLQRVMFIAAKDYGELKEKNFWRVVSASSAEQWGRTKDYKLERIFSGTLFLSLRNSATGQQQQ